VGASLAVAVSAGAGVLVLALVLWKATALRRIGAGIRPFD
jgi:hypothetical protein